jgi:hypothetical protein
LDEATTAGFHDNSPAVSFDIELGKKYASANFDYNAFDQEVDRLDMDHYKRSALSINIKQQLIPGGHWGGDQKLILAGHRDSNRTLVHELQHATEDSASDKRLRLGILCVRGVYISVPAGLAVIAAGAFYGYRFHGEERRARKVQSNSNAEIVSFTKKGESAAD